MLSSAPIDQFIRDGFIKLESAFPREVADRVRAILWRDTGCDEHDPSTWTRPVIRLGMYDQEPFRQAVNSPALLQAFDTLAGPGRWRPRSDLGTFPIRFPSSDDPADTGWHVDPSFPPPSGDDDYLNWHVNVTSRGRALLLLFLFSDVGEQDAPTRLRVGSHIDIAKRLAPAGPQGLSLRQLAADGFAETEYCAEAVATGEAGTVYLCHPFLVHAAQPHQGERPRFLAQPPLLPGEPFQIHRADGCYSPVEQVLRRGFAL